MTTEMLEETAAETTEALPGTEQAAPETPATTEVPDVDAHFESFLREQGLESPTETGEQVQNTQGVPEEQASEIADRARREAETAMQQRQAQVGYRNAMEQIDQWAKQLPNEHRDWLLKTVNQLHAQSAAAIGTTWRDSMESEFAKLLPEAERRDFLRERISDKDFSDLGKAFKTRITKGLVPEADIAKREKAAANKAVALYKQDLQAKGLIPGSKTPKESTGPAASAGGPLTLEQAMNLPISELQKRI